MIAISISASCSGPTNYKVLSSSLDPKHRNILKLIYDEYWHSTREQDDWDEQKPGITLKLDTILDNTYLSNRIQPYESEVIYGMQEDDTPTLTTHHDLDLSVKMIKQYWDESKVMIFSKLIKSIVMGSYDDKNRKRIYEGVNGAKQFIFDNMESGLLNDLVSRDYSRLLNTDNYTLMENYEKEEFEHFTIPTGIRHLDEAVQMKRGHLVGLLGYNKHRKTTLCRTIAYNAVKNGLNVIWFTLEQTYLEELEAFQIMHCHDTFKNCKISATRLNRHLLTEPEKNQLKKAGLMLEQLPGNLKIIEPGSRTWENLKNRIEMEQLTTKYDIVVVDYLTLVSNNNKSKREGMDEIIMDAKQLAKSQEVLLLTPIQGNREGKNRAETNGFFNAPNPTGIESTCGCWDKEGIDTYSEFNKSCDTIFTVWYDSDLKYNENIIIGLLFCRRAEDMPPLVAIVNNDAGYIFQNINTYAED